MHQATVSAGLASGLLAFAKAKGIEPGRLLLAAGLSPDDLTDHDARLPLEAYMRLTRAAQKMTGDPALSLHYAETMGMAELSVVGLIMEASATMGEAFLQLQRYGRLAAETGGSNAEPDFALAMTNGKLFMEDRRQLPGDFHELREGAFVRLVCGPRRFLSEPHVLSVYFTHKAPSYRAEYERIFQCPVHFGAERNAMELHPEIIGWPVAKYPRYAFAVLTRHADRLLDELEAGKSWRGKTEKEVVAILHHGDVSAERVASSLGFSRQTLFRKLKEENTTFAEVVEALRKRLAQEYLSGQRTSVYETAYLLGFSDPASFTRAFRRWVGESPTDYRARMRSNEG